MTTPATQQTPTPGAATPPAPAGDPGKPATAASSEPSKTEPDRLSRLAASNRKLERELGELKGKLTRLTELETLDAALTDPEKRYELLEKRGIKYSDWTDRMLASAGAEPKKPTDPELQKALDKIAQLEKSHSDAQSEKTRLLEAAKANALLDYTKKYVETGEEYALTRALGRHGDLITEYKRRHESGELVGDEPADEKATAAAVELRLEHALTTELTGLLKSAKGKALVRKLLDAAEPKTAPPSPPAKGAANGSVAKPPAVTNGHSAERSSEPDYSKLSDAERRKRALDRVMARTS